MKVNPEENNVYHLNGSLVGKWIYGLDRNLRSLEEKKPFLNCTYIAHNWEGRTVYGNCIRQDREVYVTAHVGSLKMCGSRFNVYINYFYDVTEAILTETLGLVDDVLYRVYGVYYIDHPHLLLRVYGEDSAEYARRTIGNEKFFINRIYISLSPALHIAYKSSIEGKLKLILPGGTVLIGPKVYTTTNYDHAFIRFRNRLATPLYGEYRIIVEDVEGNVIWEKSIELEKYSLCMVNASLNLSVEEAIFEIENKCDIPTYIVKAKVKINDVFYIEQNLPHIPIRALSKNVLTLNIPIDLPPKEVRKVDIALINDKGEELVSYSFKYG